MKKPAEFHSSTFRLIWGIVTIFLLLALIGVVRLVWTSNPLGAEQPRPRQTIVAVATPTLQPSPSSTSSPSPTPTRTPVPTVALGNPQRIGVGGFRFQPLADQTVEISQEMVTLSPASSSTDGMQFQLMGGAGTIDGLVLAAELADEQSLILGEPVTITVAGEEALRFEATDATAAAEPAGWIVVAQPARDQWFAMSGFVTASEQMVNLTEFEAILGSVTFFTPTVAATQTPSGLAALIATPTTTQTRRSTTGTTIPPLATRTVGTQSTSDAAWQVYSNANVANGVTAALNTIWVATDGGVIAWNKNNGTYTKYTTLDGLAANRTTSVINCPLRGFGIVFGSEAGLQIFDNQTDQWRVLNSSNSGMSFDDVTALYCDAENRFFVVGYKQHGLDLFDANAETWRYIGQNDGLQNNLVEAMTVVGDQEEIWVSSGLGISVLPAESEPQFFDEATSPLETNQIRRMVVDKAGTVWLGAQDALYKFADDTWAIYDQREVLASRFPSGALNGLAVAADNTLWIGSNKGEICQFDPVRVQCLEFFSGEPGMVAGELTSLTIGADGAIYYTTAGGGVSMYLGGRWRAFTIPDEPVIGNEIHSITQSEDGNLWIVSEQGIQAINPLTNTTVRQFTRDESKLTAATREVLHASPEGGIWYGAIGASYFNGLGWTSYTVADGLAGSLVQAIATDSQGRTWFGTEAGLSIWNGSEFFNLTEASNLPHNQIIALLADDEMMWISAVDAGLLRFERNQLRLFTMENSALPSNTITALARSAEGELLVGHNRGLSRLQGERFVPIPELNGYAVRALAVAPDGTIWVGTNGDGLLYFNGEQWGPPPSAVRPPSPQISTLLVDRVGSIWVGAANGGLLRYALSGNGAVVDSELEID